MAEKKLTKKDLNQLFLRSNAIQSAFNFERMQGMGFIWAMIPVINKLYDTKEERIEGYKRHIGYFNSHPWLVGPIYGIVASMEEKRASGEDVTEEKQEQTTKEEEPKVNENKEPETPKEEETKIDNEEEQTVEITTE